MAGAMSDYLEAKLLNLTLRATAYTAPAAVYVALHTADPTDAATATEVSGNGYARKQATFGAPVTNGANQECSNSQEVIFDVATASWGTITHASIWDAVSAGNMLYSTALSANTAVGQNNQFKFAVGALKVSLDS